MIRSETHQNEHIGLARRQICEGHSRLLTPGQISNGDGVRVGRQPMPPQHLTWALVVNVVLVLEEEERSHSVMHNGEVSYFLIRQRRHHVRESAWAERYSICYRSSGARWSYILALYKFCVNVLFYFICLLNEKKKKNCTQINNWIYHCNIYISLPTYHSKWDSETTLFTVSRTAWSCYYRFTEWLNETLHTF